MWGQRVYSDGSTLVSDSAGPPCLHRCPPRFPAQAFPTATSSPTSPWAADFPQVNSWDRSTIRVLQLPALRREGAASPSASSASPLLPRQFPHPPRAPTWGSDPCFSPPTLEEQAQSYELSFPLTSFTLLSFVWFYIFFSGGQVLLPALSWHSARSPVSEGVFLMYLWRETNSTSTCSSTISFPLI